MQSISKIRTRQIAFTKKYIFASLLSIFFFALTYSSSPGEFLEIDLVIITFLLLATLGIQIYISRMCARRLMIQNFLLAGFTTINILYVNLVMNSIFLNLPRSLMVLALLLSIYIIATFMKMMDENMRIAKVFLVFITLMIASVLVQTLFSISQSHQFSMRFGKIKATNIQMVNFEAKPNVYFISFDALIPKALLQKHLNLETTPYHDVLDSQFQAFKNFFANQIRTMRSLNSLLALDTAHYSKAVEYKVQKHFFPGLIPSPLFDIFKHNGYETNSLYRSLYFGKDKGPFVDNYFHSVDLRNLNKGVCEFIPTWGFRTLTFFGYCSLVKSKLYRKNIGKLGIGPVDGYQDQIHFLIDHMRSGLKKKAPQFFLAYIFSPGHATGVSIKKNTGEFDEYRQRYIKSSEITAVYIEQIVSFITKEDPKAIVYVFGDHGALLSRNETLESDATFVVQDRYGIYGGIHPKHRCAGFLAESNRKHFATILQGAHTIIECLAGGENVLVTTEDFTLPLSINEEIIRYENYLYE